MLHIHENVDGTYYIEIVTEDFTFSGNFVLVDNIPREPSDTGLVIDAVITST